MGSAVYELYNRRALQQCNRNSARGSSRVTRTPSAPQCTPNAHAECAQNTSNKSSSTRHQKRARKEKGSRMRPHKRTDSKPIRATDPRTQAHPSAPKRTQARKQSIRVNRSTHPSAQAPILGKQKAKQIQSQIRGLVIRSDHTSPGLITIKNHK